MRVLVKRSERAETNAGPSPSSLPSWPRSCSSSHALTVDLGLAYTYKRQAQTAADAAVLAATSMYVDAQGHLRPAR